MTTLTGISPVDRSVFAGRDTFPPDAARAAVHASAALPVWIALPRQERIDPVLAGAPSIGATAHIPTDRRDDIGSSLTPQMLEDVTHEMEVMREESFGPVVGIMPVADHDEAVRPMNDSCHALTARLWSRDIDLAARVGDRPETGTVFLNRADDLDPALCWTGCKDTGRGTGLSEPDFHAPTRPKSYRLRKSTT